MRRTTLTAVGLGALIGSMSACEAEGTRATSAIAANSSVASGVGGASSSSTASAGGQGGTLFMVGGSGPGGSTPLCGQELVVTVRDFSNAHPDFETFTGTAATTGLVEDDLGSDGTPVYAASGATSQTTGPTEFAQWYHDDAVNQTFAITIALTETSPGVFGYDDSTFFPIDGMGFGNEGQPHNFHFTTEIHTEFQYEGGEVFTFTGDDDLWLFINGKLAIDLGGLHPPLSATVDLDAEAASLGINVGGVYPMDIFHAERHTTESNFRLETTIGCFTAPPQ